MPNRLADETSPYLIQHRDNPVHWRPWGEAALAEARETGKPILLSVGYAACHWCHVMAHESFEDAATAQLMNELFVNIKVDREERPDLDAIYQEALALMGEQGGWPLTIFLTPAGEPFWGGTYFPPEPRYGRPGFKEVLRDLAEIYRDKRDKVTRNTRRAGRRAAPARVPGAARGRRRPARGSRDGWCRKSTRSMAASAALPNSRRRRSSSCCGAGLSRGEPGASGRGDADARPHVPRRHLRPSRRRLRALLDRSALARAAFREDALRQRADDRAAGTGLAGKGIPLYAARVAETVGWLEREMMAEGTPSPRRRTRKAKAKRANSTSGPRRRSTGCWARRARLQARLRRHRGKLGGQHDPRPLDSGCSGAGRGSAAARGADVLFEVRAKRMRARTRRQGARRLERADDRRAGARAAVFDRPEWLERRGARLRSSRRR